MNKKDIKLMVDLVNAHSRLKNGGRNWAEDLEYRTKQPSFWKGLDKIVKKIIS